MQLQGALLQHPAQHPAVSTLFHCSYWWRGHSINRCSILALHLTNGHAQRQTIGQQNIDFEIENFQTNTIPLYVIMDEDGKVNGQPKGTDLDVQSYLAWLKSGLVSRPKGN